VNDAAIGNSSRWRRHLITKMTVPVLLGGRRFGVQLAATGALALAAGAAVFFSTVPK